jgi:hypothetical protein
MSRGFGDALLALGLSKPPKSKTMLPSPNQTHQSSNRPFEIKEWLSATAALLPVD